MIEAGDGNWRYVVLHDCHNGQMVTPIVECRREGANYRVRYRMHDASDQARPGDEAWVEIVGGYHEVSRRLREAGIVTDDHQF